jgi:glycosyltransferase involved in cell wall biosynthesis
MRFALLAPQYAFPKTGGVGPHAGKLAEALVELGDEVLIVSEGPVSTKDGSITVRTVGSKWGFVAAFRSLSLIFSFAPDVVLIEYTPFNFGPRSVAPMAVAAFARARGIRVATYVHEVFYQTGSAAVGSPIKAKILTWRDHLMLRCSQRHFVANSRKRDRLLSLAPYLNATFVEVLPIGANIEPGRGEHWRAELADPSTIMSFGVVMPRRRFELIIGALARLVSSGRDLRLRLVGNIFDRSYADRCRDLAESYGLADRVVFTGALEDSDVSLEFQRAYVYAYALEDGIISSSGSLLAAFAHGVPIVAALSSSDEEKLAACTLRASNEDGIASAIARVLDDPVTRDALARDALTLYREEFEWKTIASTLRRLCA